MEEVFDIGDSDIFQDDSSYLYSLGLDEFIITKPNPTGQVFHPDYEGFNFDQHQKPIYRHIFESNSRMWMSTRQASGDYPVTLPPKQTQVPLTKVDLKVTGDLTAFYSGDAMGNEHGGTNSSTRSVEARMNLLAGLRLGRKLIGLRDLRWRGGIETDEFYRVGFAKCEATDTSGGGTESCHFQGSSNNPLETNVGDGFALERPRVFLDILEGP